MKHPIISSKKLPAPRLELRWQPAVGETQLCDYNLVIALREHDRRREDEDGEDVRAEQAVKISQTAVSGGGVARGQVYLDEGAINTPFRDGAHIRWDSHQLKLPAYVVADGFAQKLDPLP